MSIQQQLGLSHYENQLALFFCSIKTDPSRAVATGTAGTSMAVPRFAYQKDNFYNTQILLSHQIL